MTEFLLDYDLLPFHFSVLTLVLLSMAETIGYYIGLRPSSFLARRSPQWLKESPLFQVKFSKILIMVFCYLISA